MDEPPSFSLLINILFDQSLLFFLFAAALLLVVAWSSAIEAAFFSLNTDDIDRFKNSNNENEQIVAALVVDPRLLLGVLTACKYSMLVAAAILSVTSISYREIITSVDGMSIATGVLLLTLLFVLAGVILPKIYGTTYYHSIVKRNSKACKRLIGILKPILRPLLIASIKVEKKLEAKSERNSIEQLTQALQLATVDDKPTEGAKEILQDIINFGTLTVKQIMTPLLQISFTDASLNFHDLIGFVERSGYSRVPVCRGSLDRVEGVLYIKDLLPFLDEHKNFPWQRLLRPAYYVPETKKIDILLKDFQEKRIHMALVVNHMGRTTGLITLEDIIEEITGDINDEFDEVGVDTRKVNK